MRITTPWNPSDKAIKKVKDKILIPTKCNLCSGKVTIINNQHIYGREYGKWPWMYFCEQCRAYVGMHPFTNLPLGTLADKETREARKLAKPHFEVIWKTKKMKRGEAYKWLANKLNIKKSDCHFGLFDTQTCEKAKQICKEYLKGIRNDYQKR